MARMLDVSHQTVANWVKAHADQLPDPPPVPAEHVAVAEREELFTVVERQKTSSR